MSEAPTIRVTKIDRGPYPDAPDFNPKISSTAPLLLVTLEIRTTPNNSAGILQRLEKSLLAISPRFLKHECRGPDAYHVFRSNGKTPGKTPGTNGVEPGLAIAHLIEHAVIDFQCAITGLKRCSGITAAYRGRKDRFDLMIECPDLRVGRCSLALALSWVTGSIEGLPAGADEKEILDAARLVYERRGQALTPPAAARALSWPVGRAAHALAALRDVGYLREADWTVNLSGIPVYRLAEA